MVASCDYCTSVGIFMSTLVLVLFWQLSWAVAFFISIFLYSLVLKSIQQAKGGKVREMFELKNAALMEKTLDALWLRQKVISNNIANVDTPGFKSLKVVFEDLLKDVLTEKTDIEKTDLPEAKVVQTNDTAIREDGNNVDIDKENLELYRVQIQYEYMIRKIASQFSKVKTVLTETR